ncbi:MAG: cytidine deaminase [Arachnia sp.]
MSVDWQRLRDAAREISTRAYVPYSNYPVGAAAFTTAGKLVIGCNVENASYGVTLCAECGLVSSLVAQGGGELSAFLCVNREGETIMPCGRCRQLLHEHASGDMLIETPRGVMAFSSVLPQAFGPNDLQQIQ